MYMQQLRNSLLNGLSDLAEQALMVDNQPKAASLIRLMVDITDKGTALGNAFSISLSKEWDNLTDTLTTKDWSYLSAYHGVSPDKLERITI